jgi:hypothetical protein
LKNPHVGKRKLTILDDDEPGARASLIVVKLFSIKTVHALFDFFSTTI